MKLGLGRLKDVLKTGSGTAPVEGEKEQAENTDKAEKEEMQTIKSEENKLEISEEKEGNTMELKKTGWKRKKDDYPRQTALRPRRQALFSSLPLTGQFHQPTPKEKSAFFIPETRYLKKV